MADDPAFLFYPGDYLRDTQCLSEKVQVAYDRIICEHMRNICISQQQLNFFTKRLNADEKSELMQVLLKVSGGFQIKWVADSILKRREYSESRRKNREGKGKNNQQKPNNTSSSYVPHMENANEIVNEDVIKDKSELVEKLLNDEFYVEGLRNAHRGKDIKQAFEECYIHHSNAPNPPRGLGEWKQKLNTWLSNTKFNGKSNNKQQHTNSIKDTIRNTYGYSDKP